VQNNPYVLMAYALFGLLIAIYPALARERIGFSLNVQPVGSSTSPTNWILKSICLAMITVGIIVVSGESSSVVLLLSFGLIAVASSMTTGKLDNTAILPNLMALCVATNLLWWCKPFNFTSIELWVFGLTTYAFIVVFIEKEPLGENGSSFKWLVSYAMLAVVLSFSTGILLIQNNLSIPSILLHWGAFIGPAEILLKGAAIFHDFPAQYGLGPTALIAGFCSNDCWRGMYYITGFTTFVFSVLIAVLALAMTRKRGIAERFTVLALCLVACFFWTSYPPVSTSPILTPSVTGLRYLPVVMMVTYLFFRPKIEFSKTGMFIAHCMWVFGVLWSPDSAFYLTCVWWPYYIFLRRGQGDEHETRTKALFNSFRTLLLIATSLAIGFACIYHLIYHKMPTFYGLLAFILNPPLPIPIDPHGAVWYFVLSGFVGVLSLLVLWRKSGDTVSFRQGFLVLLLGYSVFSYCFGRGLDNNMFNIMPFIVLILLHVMTTAENKDLRRTSVMLAAALLGWLPVFGWQPWRDNIIQNKVLTFEPKLVREATSFSNPLICTRTVSGVEDATQAIEFIHHRYGEPVTVLDFYYDMMIGSKVPQVWSAMNNPANYIAIPSDRRREFLIATAASLNRPGWLIVYHNFPADEWLADFDSAYDRTDRLEFGTYYAIRYSPKTVT